MVQVRVQGIKGSEDEVVSEREQIRRIYEFALDRFAHTIRTVEVWCSDVNGPKGGLDKLCRVQLTLHPGGCVTAKCARSSFAQAASEACDKVKAIVAKKLSKRKSFRMRLRRA